MKKVLTILVLAALIPACLFASNLFGFTVGATAAYQKASLGDVTEGFDVSTLKLEDFKFGADVDLRLLFLDVNGKGFYAKNAADQVCLNGIVSANLSINILVVGVKAGLGYQYAYNTVTKEFEIGREAKSFDQFKDACFDIYAGLDVKLGKVVVGAYATLPTGVSIAKNNWTELLSTVQENWKSAQFGLSVGFAIL